MRVLVIEDENLAAKRLIKLIQEELPEAELIGNLDTVTASVHWLETNP